MVLQIGAGLAPWLVLDYLWLGLLMNGFYKAQLGTLARRSGDSFAPLWTPAILPYVPVVIAIAVVDMAWGAFVCAAVTVVMVLADGGTRT